MGRYDFNDVALSNAGDLVIDVDPTDTGLNVGWDFMDTQKYARESRRIEMLRPGTNPDLEFGTLVQFYLEALRSVYPGVSDEILLAQIREWGYIRDDYFEGVRQTMRERLKTTNEDWRLYTTVGCDLELDVGEDITFDTLESLRNRIFLGMTYDSFIDKERLKIRYYRGGQDIVLLTVDIMLDENVFIREVVPFSFTQGPYLIMKEMGI
ncbi:MAG: hypothetical protein A2Y38_07505 [Spirochaetes bacterium GWB1_59_5]|nr:MAG: hypothetical protein A2Y38_07505 [Spirochaetes bacterium GWB1_59_5]